MQASTQQHFIAHSKTGKKKCELFFCGKFRVARVQTCFDNYNINECKASEVWCFSCTHCTRCNQWYWPLPYIESLIFLWWGKLSSNGMCLFWPPTQHQGKGLNQVDQDGHKLEGSSLWAAAYAIMYLVSITHTKLVQSYSLYLVEKTSLYKARIIPANWSYTHCTVVVSLVKTQY